MKLKYLIAIIVSVIFVGSFSLIYILENYTLFVKMFVGGTEYSPGANGRTFVQLLQNGFNPINNAVCKATIFYPDNSYFYNDAPMMPLGKDGMYYIDFIAPNMQGVYMVSIQCTYPNNMSTYYPDQYDVNKGSKSGNIQNVYENDKQYMKFYPNDNGVADFEFWFEPVDNTTKELDVYYNGRMGKTNDDTLYMYVWNNCDNEWEQLPNVIDYYHPFVSNVIDNNISCYIDTQYHSVGIRLYGTDLNPNNQFDIDLLKLEGYTPSSEYISDLRGGGEIHVEIKKFEAVPSNSTPSLKVIS